MALTTRTKITLLFASIVSILILLLNILVFEGANNEWQSKKDEYMHKTMESMLSLDEAKTMFVDLEVLDASGTVIHKQGIFTHNMKHDSIASWFFHDPSITIAGGRAYYWGIVSKGDGYTYKTVDDVTDIILTRDIIIERSLWLSAIGFLLIIVLGYFFSGYILRPIQNMNEATRRFSLSQKMDIHHVGIYGNIKDEVVILARSLEELFTRVNKEASRLEQFSDDIAHEIKNKLFEVMSSLDLAENPKLTSYAISKAKKILRDLSSVVDALLFFARNDLKEPENTDISSLLTVYKEGDSRVQIQIEDRVMLPLYPELFQTAIGNIIGNAEKFTPPDGRIDIILKKHSLEIHDSGIGIPKKHLSHIFDRFYKVDKARASGSGQGLGLAITKKIIEELHGMTLRVESTEGKGASFFIEWNNS